MAAVQNAAVFRSAASSTSSRSGRQAAHAVASAAAGRIAARSSQVAGSRVASRRATPAAASSYSTSTVALLGGLLGGDKKKTVVITGTSSGLGRETARVLIESGKWHVIMANRDVEKTKAVCEELDLPKSSYTIIPVDLASLDSVNAFVGKLKSCGRTIDVLLCNAAVYLPNQQEPTYTEDGFEMSFQVNHLAHFLLVEKWLPELKKVKGSRCIIVGSITGNTNTVGGGAVAPFADLGDLRGLAALAGVDGYKTPTSLWNPETGKAASEGLPSMLDGKSFNGAKAYKDSKLCNMMTVLELHRRYHESTGVVFSSMYPGCIAETALFRQKRTWFRKFFPIFMKYVTGGYVSEPEAGERLAQVVADPRCAKSGIYWSWNGGAKTVGFYDWKKGTVVGAGGGGGELFENKPSAAVRDEKMGAQVWDLCEAAIAPWTGGKKVSQSKELVGTKSGGTTRRS